MNILTIAVPRKVYKTSKPPTVYPKEVDRRGVVSILDYSESTMDEAPRRYLATLERLANYGHSNSDPFDTLAALRDRARPSRALLGLAGVRQ